MKKLIALFIGVASISALTSCGLLERREPAVGTFIDDPQASVVTPSEVKRGEPFEVTVKTLGGDCTKFGDTLARVAGLEASVTPVDMNIIRPSGCLLYAEEIVHTVALTFEQAGLATIAFYGQNSDYSSPEKLVSVTRTVPVR